MGFGEERHRRNGKRCSGAKPSELGYNVSATRRGTATTSKALPVSQVSPAGLSRVWGRDD